MAGIGWPVPLWLLHQPIVVRDHGPGRADLNDVTMIEQRYPVAGLFNSPQVVDDKQHTSSISGISGSTCTVTEKPSRAIMPEE